MAEPFVAGAAFLRARVRLRALFEKEGVKRFKLDGGVNDRDAWLGFVAPDERAFKRLQTALFKAISGSKATQQGVTFPLLDMRGNAGAMHAARIVRAFHRFFDPSVPKDERSAVLRSLTYASVEASGGVVIVDGHSSRTPSIMIVDAVDKLFRSGKDADVEKLIALVSEPLGRDAAPPNEAKQRALVAALRPLAVPRVVLSFAPGAVSVTGSHLRGPAYWEVGQIWPTHDAKPMQLLLQLAAPGPVALPKNVALLQVFVGRSVDEVGSEAVVLRTYAAISSKPVAAPVAPSKKGGEPLAIVATPDRLLPDYDDLAATKGKRIRALCEALNEAIPEDAYAAARARFVAHPETWTFAGGQPRWLQHEEPIAKGETFVLQLGSTRQPLVQWGESGVWYLFAGPKGLRWTMQQA